MIPKKIHYCWFGGKELPEDARRCIESWRKFLPDYEIKEWNESNFDINCNQYVREAYVARKFAFVTDYVRLFALKHDGGVYMDTDVEVLKSYDPFLHLTAFSGFENNNYVPTGMMASEKGGKWVTELLDEYKDRNFIQTDGSYDMTTNTFAITAHAKRYGLKCNNTFQDIKGLATFFPSDYFCPKDHTTGKIMLTENSVCIHHFAASWLPHNTLGWRKHQLKVFLAKILGQRIITIMSDLYHISK